MLQNIETASFKGSLCIQNTQRNSRHHLRYHCTVCMPLLGLHVYAAVLINGSLASLDRTRPSVRMSRTGF